MRRLIAEGSFVEDVAKDSQREDGHSEGIAAVVRISAEDLGEGLVAIFVAGGEVPESRIEKYTGSSDYMESELARGEEEVMFGASLESAYRIGWACCSRCSLGEMP